MSDAVTGTGTGWQQTKYYKAFAYVAGVVLAAVIAAFSDGELTQNELIQLVVGAATALTVWGTANLPDFPKLKELSALFLTLVNVIITYLTGEGITGQEWVNLAALALGVIGVVAINNPVKASSAGAPPPLR